MSNQESIQEELELFNEDEFIVIEGTAGNDDILGTNGDDSIRGIGGDDTLSGLVGNDILDGGSGADSLIGNEGEDTLDGGSGNDTMAGGQDDDTYIVNSENDVIIEELDQGRDTVLTSISYILSDNVENLELTDTESVSGTGNDIDNNIKGNRGDNFLSGLGGNDTLIGSGGDDTLDGGSGTDNLIGGPGDDNYIVDSIDDRIVEQEDAGIDTVTSAVTYSLEDVDNVENLRLDGEDDIDGFGNEIDNIINGNRGNNELIGGDGNDTLRGGVGDDTLNGQDGENLLIGASGSDTYVLSSRDDEIVETGTDSQDRNTVVAPFNYTLGDDLQNLTLEGNDDLTGEGNEVDNFIVGNEGNNELAGVRGDDTLNGGDGDDTLNGGAGADSMIGGAGNDRFIVDNRDDIVQELNSNPNEIDEVRTSVGYTLSENVERLLITNNRDISGTGNAGENYISGRGGDNELSGLESDDTLLGKSGDDTLDGGPGNDRMVGGPGNDTYVYDSEEDRIEEKETDPEQIDTVRSFLDFTLGENLENLVLLGEATNGVGNAAANSIEGNELNNLLEGQNGDDELIGQEGNDTLDGGQGNDTLAGGVGNDTYIVNDSADEIIEAEDEGIDTVNTTVPYELPDNVENISFVGTGDITLSGNSSNNQITSAEGNDLLKGGKGDDTLIGNEGDDTLDGGSGTDSMEGGAGNDTYFVSSRSDIIVEAGNAPNEVNTVISSVSFDLNPSITNVVLVGDRNFNSVGNERNNTITGNDGDDIIEGLVGNDTLIGGLGDDTLDGGPGNDNMAGGEGDDSYLVDEPQDTITELADEGVDQVTANSDYTLGANLENLILGEGGSKGTGNDLDNEITGNERDNNLIGGDGNDTLDGVAGSNRLEGGQGDDNYVINGLGDTIVEVPNGGIDTVTSFVDFELSDPNLENLTLTGDRAINGTGNALDNEITGNDIDNLLVGLVGNDTLVGEGGNDTLDGTVPEEETPGPDSLVGGAGNDLYLIDSSDDEVVEENDEGIDTIQSSVPYDLPRHVENIIFGPIGDIEITGNSADNRIVTVDGDNLLEGLEGNDTLETGEGDDTLDGGEGVDAMSGGLGSDTYFVDDTNDQIRETAPNPESEDVNEVNASVNYRLSENLNNLTLRGRENLDGTGNGLDNVLNGNDGDNRLDGASGADTMIGGAGNDTYVVDNQDDVVIENGNDSEDEVEASIEYTLGDNIENITLIGSNNISGTGNRLDNSLVGNQGNNTLTGLDGEDTLNGGGGVDTLVGGDGNDTYVIENSNDRVIEEADGGDEDIVLTSTNYTLPDNVEDLTLTGNGTITGTGNTQDNRIIGNDSANTLSGDDGDDTLLGGLGNDELSGGDRNDLLIGGAGQDTLTGGPGEDSFFYESPDQGPDSIEQYVPNDDTIEVSGNGFGGDLEEGRISSDQFVLGTGATSSQQRFIYDQQGNLGTLFYDSDGSGPLQQVRLLSMDGRVDLTNNDIRVV